MGNQQNPDGIYVPPGINKRYPLDIPTKAELKAKHDRETGGFHPSWTCGEDCSGCVEPGDDS